jgi:cobalt-zinc-cadmium resistance protein CzcA
VLQIADLEALPVITTDTAGGFYFEKYRTEQQQVAASEIAVRQLERLPGLLVGYLRVPEPDTDFRNRLRVGVTVPLFQGQYKGEVEAAKIALETAQTETALQVQQAQAARFQLLQTLAQTSRSLEWFETTGLEQADELATISRRLYEGGEFDYVLMLRNVADAFDVQSQYLATLKRHNEAVIGLEFLNGQ